MNSIKRITLLVAMLFCVVHTNAQTISQEPTISVSISASEELPADLIIFNISINAQGATPREAFDIHKKRESVLSGLLKKLEFNEENIRYEPVSINRNSRNRGQEEFSQTNQSVAVTFSDFNMFEEVQLTLIENDFDTFNASFSSTKIEEGKEKALQKAIKMAKSKAELIAEASGVDLSGIHFIQYAENNVSAYRQSSMDMMVMSSPESSMMDFDQTVSVSANINIQFIIRNN